MSHRFPFDVIDKITPHIFDHGDITSFLLATSTKDDLSLHFLRSVKSRRISASYDDDSVWESLLQKGELLQRLNNVHIEVPVPKKPSPSDANDENSSALSDTSEQDFTVESQAGKVLVNATTLRCLSISQGTRLCNKPPLSNIWDELADRDSLQHFRIAVKDYGLSSLRGYKLLTNLTAIEIYLCPGILGTEISGLLSFHLCHFISQNSRLQSLIIRENCGVRITLLSLLLCRSIKHLHTLKLCGRLHIDYDDTDLYNAWATETHPGYSRARTSGEIQNTDKVSARQYFKPRWGVAPLCMFLERNVSTLRTLHLFIPLKGKGTDLPAIVKIVKLKLDCISGMQSVVRNILLQNLPGPVSSRSPEARVTRLERARLIAKLIQLGLRTKSPPPKLVPGQLRAVHNLSLSSELFEVVLRCEKTPEEPDSDVNREYEQTATSVRHLWRYTRWEHNFPTRSTYDVAVASLANIRSLTVGSAKDLTDIFNIGTFFVELEHLRVTFIKQESRGQVGAMMAEEIEWHRLARNERTQLDLVCKKPQRRLSSLDFEFYPMKENIYEDIPGYVRELGIWLAALSPLHKLKSFHGASLFDVEHCTHSPRKCLYDLRTEWIEQIARVLPALETMDHWDGSNKIVRLIRGGDCGLVHWEVEDVPKRWDGVKLPPFSAPPPSVI